MPLKYGADVAAVREARAVAEQQPANDRRGQRPCRDAPYRSEPSGEHGRRNAPRMIPISITDVTSASTLASSAAFCAGVEKSGHASIGTPRVASAFAPQSAKAASRPTAGRPTAAWRC